MSPTKVNNVAGPAFIIGSPRSGTTILGNILDCHPEIGEWYEPYFIWLRYFSNETDDVWRFGRIDREKAHKYIKREFGVYRRKKKVALVVDKSPGHVFNLATINDIFPQAKWIHILRDGRDVTLSIRKEWEKRERIVRTNDYPSLFKIARKALSRQPFWRYKIKEIGFEIRTASFFQPAQFLNKSKWKGGVGWGPRFPGWEEYLAKHTSLEFNAMQWVKSIENVKTGLNCFPESNWMELRYEDLLAAPGKTLTAVLNFLGYEPGPEFFAAIPRLTTGNTRKWETGFSRAEIETIKPMLTPMLEKTGYLKTSPW